MLQRYHKTTSPFYRQNLLTLRCQGWRSGCDPSGLVELPWASASMDSGQGSWGFESRNICRVTGSLTLVLGVGGIFPYCSQNPQLKKKEVSYLSGSPILTRARALGKQHLILPTATFPWWRTPLAHWSCCCLSRVEDTLYRAGGGRFWSRKQCRIKGQITSLQCHSSDQNKS